MTVSTSRYSKAAIRGEAMREKSFIRVLSFFSSRPIRVV